MPVVLNNGVHMKHNVQKGINGRTIIVVIAIMLLLSCIAVFLFMKNNAESSKTASSKSVEEMPVRNPEAISRALEIGSAEYLQKKFGIAPEKDKIWSYMDYSVMHYRDPKTPESKEIPAGTVAPWDSWPYIREKEDANFAGLNSVSTLFYAYPSRELAIWSKELLDPEKNNALSSKDSARLRFCSSARWGWSPDNFFDPAISSGNPQMLEDQPAVRGALKGLNIVEDGGDRVMADFVWPLIVKDKEVGSLVVRCVLRADEPKCLYARAFLLGEPHLAFKEIKLCSWSGHPSSFPGSEIWIGSAKGDVKAPARGSKLPLDEYWFYVTHKKNFPVYENRGASAVFVPETLDELRYTGDWGGGIALVPRKGCEKAMVFALEDFGGEAGGEAETLIAKLRKGAEAKRQHLAQMDWNRNPASWTEQLKRVDDRIQILVDTLGADHPLAAQFKSEINELRKMGPISSVQTDGLACEMESARRLLVLKDDIEAAWIPATKDLIANIGKMADNRVDFKTPDSR